MQRFFAPGRTELAGNHTDHQLGRVLAASVDVGIRARAARRRDRRVCIHSRGYRPFTVSLDDLSVDPRAYGKPWALVRGLAAAILEAGGRSAASRRGLPLRCVQAAGCRPQPRSRSSSAASSTRSITAACSRRSSLPASVSRRKTGTSESPPASWIRWRARAAARCISIWPQGRSFRSRHHLQPWGSRSV